jgi:hypothetical protein
MEQVGLQVQSGQCGCLYPGFAFITFHCHEQIPWVRLFVSTIAINPSLGLFNWICPVLPEAPVFPAAVGCH